MPEATPCNCDSIDLTPEQKKGRDPQQILDPNKYFDYASKARPICVDACIVPLVTALWEAGIETQASCCGHVGNAALDYREATWPHPRGPSIVLSNLGQAEAAKKVVARVENRPVTILSWQLVVI